MSFKYEPLKKPAAAAGLKKRWVSTTTEDLPENRRKQNAKNRIRALKDDDFEFSRTDVTGFPVLKLIHREHTDRENLFLCYPVFPIVREAEEGWDLTVRLMKEAV